MKKAIILLALLLAVISVAIGGYTFYLYDSVEETVEEMHVPVIRDPETKKRVVEVSIEKQDPLSFLLLGVDSRAADKGRSDTMIVITLNPNTESMIMMSIPRDTRTTIIGKGIEDKVNHAYAFGGAKMSIETVEHLLDIPIDHYVTVNMESFKDIVNALGGVNVHNPFAFDYLGHQFDKGELFLDGEAALAYSRMRYNDPRGDHGRNDRQRQIINAIINKGIQLSSISKATEILDAIGNNVRTDLTFDQMKKIQLNYKSAIRNQENIAVNGTGKMISGVWYYILSEEEKTRISKSLKEHLEIE